MKLMLEIQFDVGFGRSGSCEQLIVSSSHQDNGVLFFHHASVKFLMPLDSIDPCSEKANTNIPKQGGV